ncbi:MAG: NAD-dependent epimerase/dehydratase family protein [Actinomycetota bacterium]
MRIVVTGVAGFIGSNLADALLARGDEVVGLDNFSTGTMRFLERARGSAKFELVEVDLYERPQVLADVCRGSDAVFHLAANADVRFGWEATDRDIKQNVLVTRHVLEATRASGVPRLLFSSTGSVYGEAPVIPTPEDCPFPAQTSLYGASKLAAEGLISAYAEAGVVSATVFRFVSILGPRYTHGHVVDFVAQLRRDPTTLRVLGDGRQRKSYLDVTDCVAAMLLLLEADHRYEVYNLGVDAYCTVDESAGWIAERLGVTPVLRHTGGDRGWVGDNPFIYLSTNKMRSAGWSPAYTIRDAVERTVDYLLQNEWVLERAVV